MKEKYISRRIFATLFDYSIVIVFSSLYIIAFGQRKDDGTYVVSGLPALVPILFWFIYIVLPEAFLDGTIGHHLFGLKVVSLDTNRSRTIQALTRRIFDVVDITSTFGLLAFILVQTTDNGQRVGDLVAKTKVVAKGKPVEEPEFEFERP